MDEYSFPAAPLLFASNQILISFQPGRAPDYIFELCTQWSIQPLFMKEGGGWEKRKATEPGFLCVQSTIFAYSSLGEVSAIEWNTTVPLRRDVGIVHRTCTQYMCHAGCSPIHRIHYSQRLSRPKGWILRPPEMLCSPCCCAACMCALSTNPARSEDTPHSVTGSRGPVSPQAVMGVTGLCSGHQDRLGCRTAAELAAGMISLRHPLSQHRFLSTARENSCASSRAVVMCSPRTSHVSHVLDHFLCETHLADR